MKLEASAVDVLNREIAEAFPPNKTFREPPSIEEFDKLAIVKWTRFSVATGTPVRFVSAPGIGKTGFLKDFIEDQGLQVVVLNVPTLYPERLVVPFPQEKDGRRFIDPVLVGELTSDRPKVIILEEADRASSRAVASQIMEIPQERSIDGVPIRNLVTVISCDNDAAQSGVVARRELAQASRWASVPLTRNSTPWRRALAGMYADVDLSGVYDAYNKIGAKWPGALDHLQPRTLEHVLWNILNGTPAEWGLPLFAGTRDKITFASKTDETAEPTDVTAEVLEMVAAGLGRNAVRAKDFPDPVRRAVAKAIELGKNVIIEGPPGVGKTGYVKDVVGSCGLRYVYWNAPNCSLDSKVVPFPDEDEGLEIRLVKQLDDPDDDREVVLVVDEFGRGSTAFRNMMLEVLQGGTLGGRQVRIRCVIALTNPKEVAGVKMAVATPDRAQADRFFMSVQIGLDDNPAVNEWLLATYGEIAEVFLDWWKLDLDDKGRTFISKRVLEMMIKCWGHFGVLEYLDLCRPELNGQHVPVALHDLKTRLANRRPSSLGEIIAKVDYYEGQLLERRSGLVAHPEDHAVVYRALSTPELSQLERHRTEIVRLLVGLEKQFVLSLLREQGNVKEFWLRAVIEVKDEREALAEQAKAAA